MIENATIEIFLRTNVPNSEGTPVPTWGYKKTIPDAPVETFRADVQPKGLSEAEIELYGMSNRESDAKVMYFFQSTHTQQNNRARVTSDIPGEPVLIYEIKTPNHWPIHGESILIPVVGE